MTTYVTPKKNTAYKFYVGLIDQSNTKLLKANPTIASGDFKVSTDGGAFANLTTLPSANPASGRAVMIDLSTSEMNGDNIVVQCVDAAGAEWCDLLINIQTTARQIDDLAYPATSGRSMVVDASGLVDANTVKLGPSGSGTAQTARDLGTSVLLSSGTGTGQVSLSSGAVIIQAGTGTGQLDFTSGVVKANLAQILGTALTETAGQIAAAFKKFFNIATPAATMDHLILVDTVTTYTGNTPQTGDAYARIGANGAGLTAVTLAAGSIVEATFGVGAITAAVTDATHDNSIADALLDRTDGVESSLTPRGALRLIAAATAGVLSGAATTTVTIKGAGVATTRISATVDSDGNRSALTLSP